jgi:hypothetical protein
MIGMGISLPVASKLLNHSERGVTSIYDRHSRERASHEALDGRAERLR